jgi:hypothetical protein
MAKRKGTPSPSPDEMLTGPDAAAVVGLDRTHFARLVRDGKGPPHQRVGRFILVRRGDLAAWDRTRRRRRS